MCKKAKSGVEEEERKQKARLRVWVCGGKLAVVLQKTGSKAAMEMNVDALRYLSKDDFRVLSAVELGMRYHEIVPVHRIAALWHGSIDDALENLLKYKLLHHHSSKVADDGYSLTYMGYDVLAIKAMVRRGVFAFIGHKVGTSKESDIFEVATEDGTVLAMKLHRLSLRAELAYLEDSTSYSWLYSSRLAALREFAFIKALGDRGFPVPRAIDCNRHCVVTSLVGGCQLEQVKELQNPAVVFEKIAGLVVRLAEHGFIHCDLNEFNIMIGDDEKITMIDFPQMVSASHHNAQMYFDGDIDSIYEFFSRRFNVSLAEYSDDSDGVTKPRFADINKDGGFQEREVSASGFTRDDGADIKKEENYHHIQPVITSTEERDYVNADVWRKILIGVDPSSIFNCMLVCKPCLEVIRAPEFRQSYEKGWNTNSKLVGFTRHGRGFKLLASSELGRIMNANKMIQPVDDYFITKSDTGDGVILYGCLSQNNLYISKAGEAPIRLPMPKPDFRWGATAILSQQNSYKVILAGSHSYDRVIIQTFSSSTSKWEKSEPYQRFRFDVNDYIGGPGMVSSSRGFVYWRGSRLGRWVAFYDANNGSIRRIDGPDATKHERLFIDVHYGMSPQGYLQCAISGHRIDIWGLDDDTTWKKLHSVYLNPIPKRFDFASFVPWRSDCIFVKHGYQLSLYNLHTKKLELVCCPFDETWVPGIDLVPLTMADLRIWPSSPNINSVKQMLAYHM